MRDLVKVQLEEMNKDTFKQGCAAIHKHLFSHRLWEQAKTIAITISRGKEIDTKLIIEKAWAERKDVVVPKCDSKTNTMVFRKITTFHQLEQVFFGLEEPIVNKTIAVEAEGIDLMIVPGICFDLEGYRIGYGGGYYDRYLTRYKGNTLSLAFSFQIFKKVPREPHDLPVQGLITELGVRK